MPIRATADRRRGVLLGRAGEVRTGVEDRTHPFITVARGWRRAVISSGTRKLLLAGGLNVLYLIHSLAQPGEFGVHRFPGPI